MLKNKIVFITGASSGIGAACAAQFAKAGAKLLLCARRIDPLVQLAAKLQSEYSSEIHTFQLDVRQSVEVKKAITSLPQPWKKVDILVNNAGLAAGLDAVQDGNIQDWEDMIDTNIKGVLYVTNEIIPQMIRHGSGHIINIGSIAGHDVYPKGAVYCATKHALDALTKGFRQDLLEKKIKVSTVDPGAVETNFSMVRFKGDKERAAAVYQGMQPLTPDDVADAVLYCASRPPHVNIGQIVILPTDQASARMIERSRSK